MICRLWTRGKRQLTKAVAKIALLSMAYANPISNDKITTSAECCSRVQHTQCGIAELRLSSAADVAVDHRLMNSNLYVRHRRRRHFDAPTLQCDVHRHFSMGRAQTL
jgi:hypothetical protein